MPMQAQLNNMEVFPKFSELDRLCPIELTLITQIVPFVFAVARTEGARNGLKGQCLLVLTELKKIQIIYEGHVMKSP